MRPVTANENGVGISILPIGNYVCTMAVMATSKASVGRPRNDPGQLARWIPPEGWSRLVAWVSPEEKKAIKRFALEADVTVADVVRALASGLSKGVISTDELLRQVKIGVLTMEKIPTLYERDDKFKVTPKPKEDCAWVFDGQGMATEKLDGMNVRLTIRAGQMVRLEKRRNPSKVQKANGIKDGWYVDADEHGPEDKWLHEAARNTDVSDWPDGEHSSEALGPHIQGNPLGLEQGLCLPFNMSAPVYEDVPRSFDELKVYLATLDSKFSPGHLAEGIVFHHPDGRRAKIKRKDFRFTTD